MLHFLGSLCFCICWLIWMILSPIVFVAYIAQEFCQAVHHDWKPWLERISDDVSVSDG